MSCRLHLTLVLVRCKEPFCFLSGFRASIGLPSWSRRPGQGIHSEAKETPLSRARPHVCADGKSSCEVSSVMKVDVLGPYSHPVVKMPDILTEEEDCKAHVPSVPLSLTVPLCLSLPPCFHLHTHTHTHARTRTRTRTHAHGHARTLWAEILRTITGFWGFGPHPPLVLNRFGLTVRLASTWSAQESLVAETLQHLRRTKRTLQPVEGLTWSGSQLSG